MKEEKSKQRTAKGLVRKNRCRMEEGEGDTFGGTPEEARRPEASVKAMKPSLTLVVLWRGTREGVERR